MSKDVRFPTNNVRVYIKYFRCFGVPFGEYGCRLWGYGMVEKNIFLKFNNINCKGFTCNNWVDINIGGFVLGMYLYISIISFSY